MALPLVTQAELVDALCEETGWSKSDARNFLNKLGDVVMDYIAGGNRVKLPFGVMIEPKVTPARKKRKGRNPATGEEITIPAAPASTKVKAKIVLPLKDVQLPGVKKLQSMM